jgi:hypothetical protein
VTRGLGHRYLTPARSARQGADNGQTGSYQLARRVSTDKRASVDWSGHIPVGRRKPRVILKWRLRNSVTRPDLGTIRGR